MGVKRVNTNTHLKATLLRFIVDRRVFVVGFGLYGSIHGPSEYQVNMQIVHTGSGEKSYFTISVAVSFKMGPFHSLTNMTS